ncbi:MAG: hypothetical protein H7Y04_08725 [Verrucomicrobia bacterium]|nr:hypothetical protein [Cytophagales bacterium]
MEQGLEEGLQQGLEEGLERGEKVKAEEMTKMMNKEGEAIEKIIKYTGSFKEEIEKL